MSKDSFIFYQEYAGYIEDLTGDEVKTLFTAIFLYREGKELPAMDRTVKAYFKVIKNNLDRDEQKYEAKIQARVQAGSLGGKQKQANLANARCATKDQADLAVSVPVSVPVSGNDNDSVSGLNNSSTVPHFEYSPNDLSGVWETIRKRWNDTPGVPPFNRLFLNLFPDEREKLITMLDAYGVDALCQAIDNYGPIAADPGKYGTEAKYLYKSLPGFLKAADKYMNAPTPNITPGAEDFTRYNALMRREG